MGQKGPMAIIAPAQFRARTSVMGRRQGAITAVDAAYEAYYTLRTEANANQLHQALQAYLQSHGGYWHKVPRNQASGGLLQWLHEFTTPRAGTVLTQNQRAIQQINAHDIPHSRYGVLYLFGSIDIDMNKLSIALEGAAAVGGAVGAGVFTNYGQLQSHTLAAKTFDVAGLTGVKGTATTLAAGAPLTVGGRVAMRSGTAMPRDRDFRTREIYTRDQDQPGLQVYRARAPGHEAVPVFPATIGVFNLVQEDPLLMLNPYMLAPTVLAATGAVLFDAFNALRVLLMNAVTDLFHWIKNKMLTNGEWAWDVSSLVISKAIKFVVAKCLESAAPLIGGAMDLGGGILKTIKAARERLEAYFLRRKVVLNPGHPEEAANAIEADMTKGLLSGLCSVLKGVASLSLATLLPGAGALVSALVTGVEWLVKLTWRLWEQSKINKFLKLARQHFLAEKGLANVNTRRLMKADPAYAQKYTSSLQFHPEMDPAKGGIIHDLPRFTELFKKGCDASPLIPMLTLNTGICGSLMVMMRMFDDAQAQITQSTWDAGDAYFTRLKQYGRYYMVNSGFQFKPLDANDGFVRGLLNHALQHHTGGSSKTGKALAFGSGFAV